MWKKMLLSLSLYIYLYIYTDLERVPVGEEPRHVVKEHRVVELRGRDELHHQVVHHVARHEPHRVLLVQVQLGGHLFGGLGAFG